MHCIACASACCPGVAFLLHGSCHDLQPLDVVILFLAQSARTLLLPVALASEFIKATDAASEKHTYRSVPAAASV